MGTLRQNMKEITPENFAEVLKQSKTDYDSVFCWVRFTEVIRQLSKIIMSDSQDGSVSVVSIGSSRKTRRTINEVRLDDVDYNPTGAIELRQEHDCDFVRLSLILDDYESGTTPVTVPQRAVIDLPAHLLTNFNQKEFDSWVEYYRKMQQTSFARNIMCELYLIQRYLPDAKTGVEALLQQIRNIYRPFKSLKEEKSYVSDVLDESDE